MFDPKDAMFPCDMGSAVPLGPVPKGCAALEVIVGKFFLYLSLDLESTPGNNINITARGTTEPGDFGMVVGDPLIARLKRDMPGVNVRGYPVQYPASMLSVLSDAGPNDVKARIAAQAKECPEEKFALVGYSQGGSVVQGSLAGIPKELQEKVVAVVTYGAGDGSTINAAFKTKTLSNCAPGDFVSFSLFYFRFCFLFCSFRRGDMLIMDRLARRLGLDLDMSVIIIRGLFGMIGRVSIS